MIHLEVLEDKQRSNYHCDTDDSLGGLIVGEIMIIYHHGDDLPMDKKKTKLP